MAKINKLPKSIAQRIAAGEVVERPASVVKELLENAIDAGAKNITLEIQHGGIRYIRITDDGCGIAREDVPTAFLSHATSKIREADDLDAILTLGFRGEALPSIAAVSRVEMMTRETSEFVGTRIVLEGGEQISFDDAGCPVGTTLIVRDLFFNTPARMKFLKSDRAEGLAVASVADHIALSHPEVSLRFIKDGREQMCTPGNGDLLSCIHAVYGRDFAETLLPAESEQNGVSVRGFVSKPYCSRGSSAMQHFFVNNRYIKSRSGAAALSEAYKNSVMVGKYPACVLFLTVNPAAVDVNVHPAKIEVRFSNEKSVFDVVYRAAKSALAADTSRPEAKLPPPSADPSVLRPKSLEGEQLAMPRTAAPTDPQVVTPAPVQPKPVAPAETPQQISAYNALLRDIETAFADEDDLPDLSVPTAVPTKTAAPAGTGSAPLAETSPVQSTQTAPAAEPAEDFRILGEAFRTYIFAEQGDRLLIIDKHAAHERMLYNELQKDNGVTGCQMLLVPVSVTLSKEEYAAVLAHMEVLTKAGFAAEDFGGGTVLVRACPLNLEREDITALVTEFAGHLLKYHREVLSEKLDWLYHSVACRAAVKAGDHTTDYELYDFTKRLLADPDVRYCPHGRPVLITLSRTELEKQFGRVQ